MGGKFSQILATARIDQRPSMTDNVNLPTVEVLAVQFHRDLSDVPIALVSMVSIKKENGD
jgi:hypothetical protein